MGGNKSQVQCCTHATPALPLDPLTSNTSLLARIYSFTLESCLMYSMSMGLQRWAAIK